MWHDCDHDHERLMLFNPHDNADDDNSACDDDDDDNSDGDDDNDDGFDR